METKYFTRENLPLAAHCIQSGEVVAFPTETVYGLGALAKVQEAVEKVYQAKGRPSDNPLIVHVHSVEQVKESVVDFPEIAQKLVDAFWPGPLTIILTGKPGIYAPAVSAGLPTVSFRMPNHPVTLELIRLVGEPIVGPSANRSTRPSPTKVEHVLEDLDGKIAGVCEGGASTVGVESTVLDLTNEKGPVILRPGIITQEEIEAVIGKLPEAKVFLKDKKEIPKAPGMKYRHYSPSKPVVAIRSDLSLWKDVLKTYHQNDQKVSVLCNEEFLHQLAGMYEVGFSLGERNHIASMNQHLFEGLRTLDKSNGEVILVEMTLEEGAGIAYMNRLKKAATQLYE